jgi:hypothetical protein
MGGVEWNGAVALLKAWLAHQPAPAPVAIVLAAAFVFVMFVEGLRANFLPVRKTEPRKIGTTAVRETIDNPIFAKSSALHAAAANSPTRAVVRFVPKQRPARRRAYGAPRPAVCHRIKLEMVNLEPVEQPIPLADPG